MTIKVDFQVCGTVWHIQKILKELYDYPILSFDTETRGVYTKQERKVASQVLSGKISYDDHKLASVIANNSGLSYPSLSEVTHFVFGTSSDTSVVIIVYSPHVEMLVWNWLISYRGLLLIHNALFDLKLMYHRTQSYPQYYEDTQLMAKSLTNHCDSWKAKVGLKDLMGSYYSPEWTLIDEYEPENLRDPRFLRYSAIDGAATYKLYEMLLEEFKDEAV
jgi:hypothetical protein